MKKHLYKNSGIEWLGEIPEHWSIKRLFSICNFVRGNSTFQKNELLSSGKYVALQYGKTYNVEEVNEQFNFYVNDEFYKSSQTANYGDVIFVSTSETIEDLGHSVFYNRKDLGLIGGEQILLKPKNILDGKYLYYSSKVFGKELIKFATGIKVFRFDLYDLKTIYIPLPPLPEQKAIAGYLDKACRRIDKIIEIKQKQLEKIEKHFSSRVKEILSGTNDNTQKKESGFDWFKEIPEHWKVVRLKSVLSKINSGVTPKGGSTTYTNEGIPLIRSQNINHNKLDMTDVVYISEDIHNQMINSKLMKGDVLLNITGASLGRCFYYNSSQEANVNQHVCILRPFQFIRTTFLYYLMRSEIGQAQIFSGFTGSGREGLNFESIKRFRIPLPPKDEQKKMEMELDNLNQKILTLKDKLNKQINTLQSYRKSLIHECVTGKKQIWEGEPEKMS